MQVFKLYEENTEIIYKPYAKLLSEKMPNIQDPRTIVDGDEKYFVAHYENTFGVISENEENLPVRYLIFGNKEEGKQRIFEEGNNCYHMPEGENHYAVKRKKDSSNMYGLYFSSKTPNLLDKDCLLFSQRVDDTYATFEYDLSFLQSLEKQIDFCMTHNPGKIDLSELRDYIIFCKRVRTSYKYNFLDESYSKILFGRDNDKYILSPAHYKASSFRESLAYKGLYTKIPEDLAAIITGDHVKYNHTKKLIDCYKEHINNR